MHVAIAARFVWGRYSALAAVFQPVFSIGRYEVSGVEAVCSGHLGQDVGVKRRFPRFI